MPSSERLLFGQGEKEKGSKYCSEEREYCILVSTYMFVFIFNNYLRDNMSGNPELLIGPVITTLCSKMTVTGADTPDPGLSVKFLEKC